MNTTVLSVIFFIVMLILCGAILYVFNKHIKGNLNNAQTENEGVVYKTDNALEFAKWLGKNPEELKLGAGYIKDDGVFLKVNFDGRLFDKEAHGNVFFEEDGGEIIKKANTVYIHSAELTYEECRDRLAELYGKPQSESEEPYAEVKGGAVMRCYFKGEKYGIELTKTSEREYIDITIK